MFALSMCILHYNLYGFFIINKKEREMEGRGGRLGKGGGHVRGRGVGVENVKANSKDKIFKCSESQSSLACAIKLFILAIAKYLPFLHSLHKIKTKILRC
jgi:hypothetical protein